MDPRTSYLLAALMMLLNGGVLGLMHKSLSPDVQPSAADWRVGTLLFASGSILFAVQDLRSLTFVLPLANTCMLIGLTLYARAMRRFVGLPDTPRLFVPALGGAVLLYGLAAIQAPFGLRSIVVSVLWLFILALAVRVLSRGARGAQPLGDLHSSGVLACVFLLIAGFVLLRGLSYVFRPAEQSTLLNPHDLMTVLTPVVGAVLPVIGTTAFLVMCSERIRRQWERAAATDFLTNLPNRRTIISMGEALMNASRRRGAAFAVALIDVDHFKAVNDTHGHDVGDLALKHVAATLAQHCRGPHMAGRYGGEEFVALLDVADAGEAEAAAERLRRQIEQSPLGVNGKALALTASIGVGVLAPDDRGFDDLLQRADQALYTAKAGGRNRVEMAKPPA